MRSVAIVFLALLLPSAASATRAYPEGPASDNAVTLFESAAAITTRAMDTAVTFDALEVRGYRFLTLEVDYVYDAGTAVTMTCTESSTSDGTYRTIQVLTYSGSTAVSTTKTWSKTVAASAQWPWTIRTNGYGWLKCTLTVTGGNSSDKLTLTGVLGN